MEQVGAPSHIPVALASPSQNVRKAFQDVKGTIPSRHNSQSCCDAAEFAIRMAPFFLAKMDFILDTNDELIGLSYARFAALVRWPVCTLMLASHRCTPRH